MSFPSVADVLSDFTEVVILKKITVINNANYERETISSNEPIDAVVQSQSPESLRIDNIDYSLNYVRVHTVFEVDIDDVILWQNKNYRMISRIDQTNRGFLELVGEEVK